MTTPPLPLRFAPLLLLAAMLPAACAPGGPCLPRGAARCASDDAGAGTGAVGEDAGAPVRDAGDVGVPDAGTSDAASPVGGENDAGTMPGSDACEGGLPWLTVPLRIHLLQSNIPDLDAGLDEAGFRAVLDEAAGFWTQACIRFSIERIGEEPLSQAQEETYRTRIMAGVGQSEMYALMRDAMPTGDLLVPGWNVMVFRRFPRFSSGVYMWDIRSVLFAEELPAPAGGGDNPAIILAHELGHALLGLEHYEGPDVSENLMSQEIMQQRNTAHGLTPDQIARARQQVTSGDTFLPMP